MQKHFKIGFDIWAFVLFVVIMLPNIFWFAVPPQNDVLGSESATPVIDAIGSVFQMIMIVTLCIVKNKSCKKTIFRRNMVFPVLFCVVYLVSWVVYYCGNTDSALMLIMCLSPCMAFLIYAIDRKNYIAMIPIAGFTVCHLVFCLMNFVI